MAQTEHPCYTLINFPAETDAPTEQQLKADLEKGDTKTKIEALEKTIRCLLGGEKFSSILMTIIRFVLPSQDHTIKKLLLLFWEIVPKTHPDGKLLHEMILVCDAYRKDLQHPNEFLRGSTLRFLCKLKEPELLEPLMPAIRSCLEHRHAYVRRNAVLAIYTIYKNFDFLIPDAPELIGGFLDQEQDMSCKRNAFMMLIHVDQERALNYLSSCLDQVGGFGDILQLVIVELIYKVCLTNATERARFIRCIYNLLNSNSSAVRLEAAGTLITLSAAPSAVKAAAACYIDIVVKESDNNVKLIVLDRLTALRESAVNNEKILQELVMDILRVLASTDLEVRKKTLEIVLELVSSRNVEEMVLILKKEVQKTNNVVEQEDNDKYRQLLVRTLHSCSVKFPDVCPTVIPMLTEFLGDIQSEMAAVDVLVFLREAIQRFPKLQAVAISNILEALPSIKNSTILRGALWILGEYCRSKDDIQGTMHEIRQSLGPLPIVEDELAKQSGEQTVKDEQMEQSFKKLVTADGTYATQSALTTQYKGKKEEDKKLPLRKLLMNGDFFLGAALASTLAKLALRYCDVTKERARQNAFLAESMFIMASILHLGKSGLPKRPITDDDQDRIGLCLKVLADRSPVIIRIFEEDCRRSLATVLQVKQKEEKEQEQKTRKLATSVQADDPLSFAHLSGRSDFANGEDIFAVSLSAAVGQGGKKDTYDPASSKLNKVAQLTGFSDPLYAEAYVHVNQFDILLDVLIVNQTDDVLQNVSLELATLGDLKLVEKPSPITMAPHDFANIKASVKVASTENGVIFGNIVYDLKSGVSDRNCVYLNNIQVDIMDYIVPATCTDLEFRLMWAEFEWENKVAVNTTMTDLRTFLNYLIKATNMKCLTPDKALSGDCGFMAANLYAKSIFGEDALANVSLERSYDMNGPIVTGHVRIRAKSQGMALSMGEKITSAQKQSGKENKTRTED
ncbi:coatomer subunit beta-like [Paramacrobiotus metropolitanus]|uniref:coatomer subunit beta-like n=1 Tax=Paramacrobiotus metropolitanus TaxID=2943436 RepID=UPI0024463A00|nr:coatomer subunit beta-like [Paramacrobiotus metropolitanus]